MLQCIIYNIKQGLEMLNSPKPTSQAPPSTPQREELSNDNDNILQLGKRLLHTAHYNPCSGHLPGSRPAGCGQGKTGSGSQCFQDRQSCCAGVERVCGNCRWEMPCCQPDQW